MASGDSNGIEVPKPKFGVYTMLLILAVVAIGVGTALLFAELARYEYEYKGPVTLLWGHFTDSMTRMVGV